MTKRILKYCFFILFFALISLNGKAQEEYRFVDYNNSLEIDSIKRRSDFEYLYLSDITDEINPIDRKVLKDKLQAIKFICSYKRYMYDCKIILDGKFMAKKIKLYQRNIFKKDVSFSSHAYGYGIGSSISTHHKKGDYAGSDRTYSYKVRFKKRERVYYKDFLNRFSISDSPQ